MTYKGLEDKEFKDVYAAFAEAKRLLIEVLREMRGSYPAPVGDRLSRIIDRLEWWYLYLVDLDTEIVTRYLQKVGEA